MASLEQEIRQYFRQQRLEFDDHSRSFTQLDFGFGNLFENRYFAFDAKEKQRPYRASNWPTDIPEEHLFIIDDLAARKVLLHAPNAGLIVRDTPQSRYLFFSVVDLYLMPKARVNRPIRRNQPAQKGKWLIDLRNGQACPDLPQTFAAMAHYLDQRQAIFHEINECFGAFEDEEIRRGGIERRPEHWTQDFKQTR